MAGTTFGKRARCATCSRSPAPGAAVAKPRSGRCLTTRLLGAIGVGAAGVVAQTPGTPDPTGGAAVLPEQVSLAEQAPELYYQLRRYPGFFGDANTRHGDLLERSYLLDRMYGARDWLVDRGIYLDASVTQFLQGNLAGGRDTGSGRYNGSADYWLTIDTAKAGLWSGAAVFFHAESSWQASRTVNDDAGSLVPANLDASMPTPGVAEAFALPECYLAQGLPADLLLLLGKLDWAGVADTNVFANNERTQFANAGLVNNAILAAFVPYTSLGTAVTFAPPGHALSVFFLQNNGDATTTGADDFKGDYTAGLQYAWSPKWSELPGDYRLILGYTDKTLPAPVPLRDGGDNYTVLVNFDQYLWCSSANQDGEARPGSRRAHLPPLGFGIFGRAGWAPGDRNVADQFYSLGVGGFGTLIPARDGDQWGIGWAATHIASRFRDDARGVGLGLDRFEQALEAFYNFRLTAASHLTVDAQFVDPADRALGSSCMLGIRLQADF